MSSAVIGGVDEAQPERQSGPYWREALEPYAKPVMWRSMLDLATSVVPYIALTILGYVLYGDVSYLWILALTIPTAGFLLRTYILFHDCTHGNFMPTKKGNIWLGTFLGLIVYSPFMAWKHNHQVHHATAGDLDRRGVGDVPLLTVDEFEALSFKGKLGYRAFRNPFVMFVIGPIWAMVIGPRFTNKKQRPRIRKAIMLTNLALLVLVGGTIWLVGVGAYFAVQGPAILLAGSAGVFLFYVQHQFEDAYWEDTSDWSYADAALQGSSYLVLPKVLQFFTGNIGLHHVHHLNARIPNYNLQRAHDENDIFHDVPRLSMWDGVKAVRLKLYDPRRGRLVTFAEAREAVRAPDAPSVSAPV